MKLLKRTEYDGRTVETQTKKKIQNTTCEGREKQLVLRGFGTTVLILR